MCFSLFPNIKINSIIYSFTFGFGKEHNSKITDRSESMNTARSATRIPCSDFGHLPTGLGWLLLSLVSRHHVACQKATTTVLLPAAMANLTHQVSTHIISGNIPIESSKFKLYSKSKQNPDKSIGLKSIPSESDLFRAILESVSESFRTNPKNVMYLV